MWLVVKDQKELESIAEQFKCTVDEVYDKIPGGVAVDETIHDFVGLAYNSILCDWYEVYSSNDPEWFARDVCNSIALLNKMHNLVTKGLDEIAQEIKEEHDKVFEKGFYIEYHKRFKNIKTGEITKELVTE